MREDDMHTHDPSVTAVVLQERWRDVAAAVEIAPPEERPALEAELFDLERQAAELIAASHPAEQMLAERLAGLR